MAVLMTTPLWSLLGFALWTLLLLISTIGVYRWSHILTGRRGLTDFPADKVEGALWYKRAMRAHANCVENLPVFGAIVLTAHVSGIVSDAASLAAAIILPARMAQSLIHVFLAETSVTIGIRFGFFLVQFAAYWVLAWPLISLFFSR